jgi:hypothetical protein
MPALIYIMQLFVFVWNSLEAFDINIVVIFIGWWG